MFNEKPKIEEVADQETWKEADIVYELKEGALSAGLVEVYGLENIAKFEMSSEEEDMFFKAIHKIFAKNNLKLEEKDTPERMKEFNPVGKLSRKISITFSSEAPKRYYEEYRKELAITGEFHFNGGGVSLSPDPMILDKLEEDVPKEGFTENWRGSISIYPNNISNKEEFYKSVFHELYHLLSKWVGKSYILDTPIGAEYREHPEEIGAEEMGDIWADYLLTGKQIKSEKELEKWRKKRDKKKKKYVKK